MDTEDKSKRVKVNVSGTRFEMSESTWRKIQKGIPEAVRTEVKQKERKVFLERHASVFQSILYYYQGGELHLPADVCPSSFKAELEFYGVDETCMAKCCFAKYVNYFDDQDVLKILENDESQIRSENVRLIRLKSKGGWRGIQALVWLVLNEPFYSRAAKVYFVVSAVAVLVSLFALVAGTHPAFQRDLTVDEWKVYFADDWDKYKHHVLPESDAEPETDNLSASEPEPTSEPESISEPETPSQPETKSEPETTSELEATSEPETASEQEIALEAEITSKLETTPAAETTSEPESQEEPFAIPENAFARYDYMEYIEYICVAIFSLDICIRIIFCPFRINLLFSFLNWVDIFAVSVMYAKYIGESLFPKEKYEASVLDILNCLQIVRVFRLFRLVKNFVGFRVLMYAFKASLKEMMLMSLFLFIAMLMFSTFAYFSVDDTFTSIPDSFWWAMITMTTVGYGDVVPQEGLSRLIGVVCALSGVCLLAVIIPIFVNNFMLFYSYSKVWGKKYTTDDSTKGTDD